jgi:HlyD family secretion protein
MKKVVGIVVLVVIVGVVFYTAALYRNGNGDGTLTLYGNVDIREVQMAFRVPGRILAMHYEEGDSVKVGDLLASLEATPQTDATAIAEAQVAEAQARLDLLMSGARPQEIKQARARVEESEAGLKNAESEFERQAELVRRRMSSKHLLDQARSQRDQWSARLSQAKEALALAEAGFRNEEVAQASAVLAAATARHKQAMTQLADTRLLSPSAGVVMTRVLEPGAMVSVGSPVYTLSLTENTYVRAYVDEPNLGKVVPGSKVRVLTDSDVEGVRSSYKGQVGFISPRAEFTPKNVETPSLRTDLVYRLRIVVSDADSGLRQGMPVTVVIGD